MQKYEPSHVLLLIFHKHILATCAKHVRVVLWVTYKTVLKVMQYALRHLIMLLLSISFHKYVLIHDKFRLL